MQNKANSLKAKTNPTFFTTKDYENKPPLPHSKKQTQFIAAKPLAKPEQTQFIAAKPLAKSEQTQFIAAKPLEKPDPLHAKNIGNRLKDRLFTWYNPENNPYRPA